MQQSVSDFFREIGLGMSKLSDNTGEYNLSCPFHSDSTPSLFINVSKGVVKCFGACNFGGKLYTFFKKYDSPTAKGNMYKLSAITALDVSSILSDRVIDRDGKKKAADKVDYDSLEYATEDLPYLQERRIVRDTIRNFEIHYDKQLQCLVIPCYNKDREDVGYVKRMMFGSRKYMNSQDLKTDEILFPIHKIPDKVSKIILVEGIFDAIRAHQEGYENTLSNLGGVLSDNHMKILGEHTTRVTVCPDKDDEGIRIAQMNINNLHSYGFMVDLMIVPGSSKDLAGAANLDDLVTTSYERLRFAGKTLKDIIRR